MFVVTKDQFEELVLKAISDLPKIYKDKLDNVAFIVEDMPSPDQRNQLKLSLNQTLLGLYEGVPLTQRQGNLKIIPDKITLFQLPIQSAVNDMNQLYHQIGKTIWHEVAHYFGLDHEMINKLDNKDLK